jgi:putative chitinase
MAHQAFKVVNDAGMWLRSKPVVIEETKIRLLPKGQLVTKVADTEKPDWWRIRVTVEGQHLEGFSNRQLMTEADVAPPLRSELTVQTLTVVRQLAPHARQNYLDAIAHGGPLFERHGITTPLRMAHFLAQAMHETGAFTIVRENMNYSAARLLEIFGVGRHSARVTPQEAQGLAHRPEIIAERVYGLGNPAKAEELGNTQPGDGFRFRGNGVLQTTGRGNHRRMSQACGVDFEGNPDLVVRPEHALKPALQEWTDGDLNAAADANDIRRITIVINGGLIGFDQRRTLFDRVLPMLDEF